MRYFFSLAIITLLSSCNFSSDKRANGNGNITTQARQVDAFTAIDVSGGITVQLTQQASTEVRVQTDENLQELVEISVVGNTLRIHPRNNSNLGPSKGLVVYVSAPSFKEIDASGASKITSRLPINSEEFTVHGSGASEIAMPVKVATFTAELSGASNLQLTGEVSNFKVEAKGASHVNCLALKTAETRVEASGASKAEVSADSQLTIEASGASTVEYTGNANTKTNSSGASEVRKVN